MRSDLGGIIYLILASVQLNIASDDDIFPISSEEITDYETNSVIPDISDYYYIYVSGPKDLNLFIKHLDGTYKILNVDNWWYLNKIRKIGYVLKIPVLRGKESYFKNLLNKYGMPVMPEEIPQNIYQYPKRNFNYPEYPAPKVNFWGPDTTQNQFTPSKPATSIFTNLFKPSTGFSYRPKIRLTFQPHTRLPHNPSTGLSFKPNLGPRKTHPDRLPSTSLFKPNTRPGSRTTIPFSVRLTPKLPYRSGIKFTPPTFRTNTRLRYTPTSGLSFNPKPGLSSIPNSFGTNKGFPFTPKIVLPIRSNLPLRSNIPGISIKPRPSTKPRMTTELSVPSYSSPVNPPRISMKPVGSSFNKKPRTLLPSITGTSIKPILGLNGIASLMPKNRKSTSIPLSILSPTTSRIEYTTEPITDMTLNPSSRLVPRLSEGRFYSTTLKNTPATSFDFTEPPTVDPFAATTIQYDANYDAGAPPTEKISTIATMTLPKFNKSKPDCGYTTADVARIINQIIVAKGLIQKNICCPDTKYAPLIIQEYDILAFNMVKTTPVIPKLARKNLFAFTTPAPTTSTAAPLLTRDPIDKPGLFDNIFSIFNDKDKVSQLSFKKIEERSADIAETKDYLQNLYE